MLKQKTNSADKAEEPGNVELYLVEKIIFS